MRAAAHRSRQFFGALRPRVDSSLRAEAFGVLSEGERRLFEAMTPRDQQHCLEVYRRLRPQGDCDLLVAALLHDAGKGRIALWHRVAYVLLAAAAPALLRRVARAGDGASGARASMWPAVSDWREAMYRCLHHGSLGARLARAAGASERAATLIAGEDAPGAELLRAADEA